MSSLNTAILSARRRQFFDRSLHLAGLGAALGLALGIGVLLLDRLGVMASPWWAYIALIAAGAAGGIWRAFITAPPLLRVAVQLDRSLRLKDRFATAHILSAGDSPVRLRMDGDFAALVEHDAQRFAQKLDVRSVTPIRLTRVWGGALLLAASLLAGVWYLPPLAKAGISDSDPTSPEAIAALAQDEQEREEVRRQIEHVIEEAQQASLQDDRTRERIEALERLREQLALADAAAREDQKDSQSLREETAAQMNELSRQLAEQAQRDLIAAQELTERFTRLERPDAPMTADEFDEALRRGDFGRAAESLEELLRSRESLTPQEQQELAEHLRTLSEEIERAGEQHQQQLNERREQLEQVLRDHGINDEAIRELLNETEPADVDELTDALDEHITDKELAERLARELQRQRERQDIERRVENDAEAIRESLREAADTLHPTEPPPPPDSPESPDPSASPESPATPPAPEAPAVPQPDAPQQADRPQGEEKPTQQPPSEGQTRDPAPRPEEQPSPDGAPQQGEQPTQQQGDTPQEGEREGASPQGEGELTDMPTPDGGQTGQEVGDGTQEAGEAAQQPRGAGESLREAERRRRDAEQRQRMADRLRDESNRMADPGRAGRESAREQQQPTPPSAADRSGGSDAGVDGVRTPVEGDERRIEHTEIEDVDARNADEGDPGEVIAEWLGREGATRDGEAGTRIGDAQQRVRQAQRIAERAVNDQAVPSRYHSAIRRYFGRLNETVERAAESP